MHAPVSSIEHMGVNHRCAEIFVVEEEIESDPIFTVRQRFSITWWPMRRNAVEHSLGANESLTMGFNDDCLA